MALIDSQIYIGPMVGSGLCLQLDEYVMPSTHLDAIGRDVNGMTYQKDVAPGAFVQLVEIHFWRMQIDRADLDVFWHWMITSTHLFLTHLSYSQPIIYYEGRISNLDPQSIHNMLQGTGPYVIQFKPDLASGNMPPSGYMP
jgi:hypothetical protein